MRIPVIPAIVALLVGALLDWMVLSRIPATKKVGSRSARKCYFFSALLTELLLVAAVLWPKRNGEAEILPAMWMFFTWLSVYISKLIYSVFLLVSLMFKGKVRRILSQVGFVLGIVAFVSLWYGAIIGRRCIEVTEVTVESPRIPASFDGYRIVQFSDAHMGTWGNDTTFASRLVDRINSLRPDLIVFTGDIVNRKAVELRPFLKVFARLRAPGGVYSVMGNHDYGDYVNWPTSRHRAENEADLRAMQKSMGWHLLSDRGVWIEHGGDSIRLMGVENWGEKPFKSYGDLHAAMQGWDTEKYGILLSHNPMHWRKQVRLTPVDLTLSGHTHAMQARLRTPWGDVSLSALHYPEWEGMTRWIRPDGQPSRVYVNIGSGTVGFPARVGASPEVTLLILRHE